MSDFDKDDNWLAIEITMLRRQADEATDDVLATHYKLRLDAARTELARRNAAEIRRRAEEEVS